MTEDVLLSRIKEALERVTPGPWMNDHRQQAACTIENFCHVTYGEHYPALAYVAVSSDADFIALLNPENVRALIGEVERLRAFVAGDLQANFVEHGARVAEQAPWKAKATAAEREVEKLREALNRVSATLQVPAAEYVPAIPDAWEIIDAALGTGEANPNPQQGKTL
jgi:hypothetical protein